MELKRGPQGDDPERPGQSNIGCTTAGYREGRLSRYITHRVCSAAERQQRSDRVIGTENTGIRGVEVENSGGCPPVVATVR